MGKRLAYGQTQLTWVDRFGVFLSSLAIKKYIPQKKKLNILDVGCGYHAKLLLSLKSQLEQGVGIDFKIHPDLKNDSHFKFIEKPIESSLSELKNFSPDVIMMMSVLEHLDNPEKILKDCYQLLKPNGMMLINVPTWMGKIFLECSAFKLGLSPALEMDDHKMYYAKRDLWPLLVKAGFKPSKIKLRYHKFGLNLFAVVLK